MEHNFDDNDDSLDPPTYKHKGYKCWETKPGSNLYHRLNGPARMWNDGGKEWWINGVPHREDGPAWTLPYHLTAWLIEGKKHRLDGPAVIYYDGEKQWWINGERIHCKNQEEFERLIKMKAFW